MPQFHETSMGMKFFSVQLPSLIKALNGVEEQLKRQNDINEKLFNLANMMVNGTNIDCNNDVEDDDCDSCDFICETDCDCFCGKECTCDDDNGQRAIKEDLTE